METIVTTSRDSDKYKLAREIAEAYGWTYVNRSDVPDLNAFNNKTVLVIEKERLSLYQGKQQLFFHPGLSVLRINNLISGQKDRFLEACLLEPGDSFLDCTLGMATDSIVASYQVGKEGKVVGLEAVPEIALIIKLGLNSFYTASADIHEAVKKISVENITALNYLQKNQAAQFDCIYFDPMFRRPKLTSSGMNMLRPFAYKHELSCEEISLAAKMATKCVVVKEMSLQKLQELNPDEILGGKNAKIYYARWNLNR